MKRICLFKYAAIILIVATNLSAQIRNRVATGARPLAMGEAFAGVADDCNVIYWNPAGLPLIENYGIYGMRANLYNVPGLQSNYLSFFLPFAENLAFGFDAFNIGFADEEIDVSDQKFNLALGYKISDKLSLGLNVKHLRLTGSYLVGPQNYFNTRAYGFGADVGLLYQFSKKLRLGLVVHDVTDTQVKHNGGGREVVQARNLRYGAAYWLRKNLLLAADLDDRIHLGSELKPTSFIALRAGLQKDRHTDEGLTYAFGAGLDMKLLRQTLRLDYAYTVPPALPDMSTFSVSLLFDLFSRSVRIEKVEIEPIYASLYKHHSQAPIGKAVIKYSGKNRLDYKIKVAIPPYAPGKDEEGTINQLSASKRDGREAQAAVDSVALQTVFDESVMLVEDDKPMLAEVTVSYQTNRRWREVKRTARFDLLPRNYLDWSRGIEQAAAFIAPQDQTVDAAANNFIDRAPAEFLLSPNITKAKKLFEGMGHAGIIYREDPINAYSSSYRGIDALFYPYQMLAVRKQGDCDDLTVLYAALLENREIATKLVYVPGHIFLLLDTGISSHANHLVSLCLPEEMYQVYGDEIWIPVEVTAVGQSFDEAWALGAEQFQKHRENEPRIVEVHEAWKAFKPVAYPPELKHTRPSAPDTLIALTSGRGIRDRQLEFLRSLEQQLSAKPDSLGLRNRLAMSYAALGELAKAENHLKLMLAKAPNHFTAYNNLGNVYFLQGKLDSAEASYFRALKRFRTPDDTLGTWLNLAMLYDAANHDAEAQAIYANVIRDSTDIKKAARLLAISPNQQTSTTAGLQQIEEISEGKVLQRFDEAMSRGPGKPKPKVNRPIVKPGDNIKPLMQQKPKAPFYWAN